jgi:hypothetical protein
VQLLCFPPAWASPLDEQRAIVRVPGYGVAASPPFVPSPDEPPLVRVTVEREHRVSGRVLLADEQPAQDAFVRVRCEGLPQAASGRVAEDGSFEVSGLPDGPYTIFADRSPDPGSWGALPAVPSRTSRDGVAADATDVVLRFPPAPAEAPVVPVEGTVRDAATGRPVLLFQATLGDGRRSAPASVAGPGAFRFLGMPSGTWMLRVRAPGYLEYRQPGLVLAPPAAPAPLSLRLERGVALRGTVRRAGGGALGDAPMTLTDWKRSRSVSTWIGSDGSWSESGFEAGESLEVLVRDPDGEGHWMPASGAELVVPGGAPEATVDLTAVRAGIVSFVLSGPRPASAASRVTLRDRSGRLVREWTGLKAETRWAALLPGPYTLRAEVPGAAPEERSVTLVPGRTTELTFPIP